METILAIAVPLVGLICFLMKRKFTRDDEPERQLQKRLDENDKAIAGGDVNALLDIRLRNTRPRDSSGQDSDTSATK